MSAAASQRLADFDGVVKMRPGAIAARIRALGFGYEDRRRNVSDSRKVRIVVKVYGPDDRLIAAGERVLPLDLADQPIVNVWDAWDEAYGVSDD